MGITKFAERFAFSSLASPLIRLTGNRRAQDALDGIHHVCQHLMGIGSGANCSNSGEVVAFRVLKEAVSPPFTVFDVGANVGTFSQMASVQLKSLPYVVHAFEPSADTFRALRETLAHQDSYVLNNMALGLAEGEGTLFADHQDLSVLASLTCRDLSHEGRIFDRTETVRITTLDKYCSAKQIPAIHLLKLDVEGHELDVINGGAELFNNGAVSMVMFEFGNAHIDTRVFFRDMYQFMRKHRMDVFRITRSGYLYHIPAYNERHEQFWTTNFLCIREDLCSKSRTTASSRQH